MVVCWRTGSGLLVDWCLITWTLWQYLDYGDCDSAAGGSTFADCTALTWQSMALVIMTSLGTGFGDRHISGAGQTDAAFP